MYFKDAKVGDEVWDYVWGSGIIFSIELNETFGIYVDFGGAKRKSYLFSGQLFSDVNQSLFYYSERPIVITKDDIEFPDYVHSYCIKSNCVKSPDSEETLRLKGLNYIREFHKPEPEKTIGESEYDGDIGFVRTICRIGYETNKLGDKLKKVNKRLAALESDFRLKPDYRGEADIVGKKMCTCRYCGKILKVEDSCRIETEEESLLVCENCKKEYRGED